ncbi:MAG: hypothetical protein OXL41_06380 [Nitrospinae bacterium]|nr:hypothetical protein [Nitrospinota bacterium]
MAANSRSFEGNGRGRFGGEQFGQVPLSVLKSGLTAYEIATLTAMTIRAAEPRKPPLNEVRCSPQDVARDLRVHRNTATKALNGLELAGFIEQKESGEGKKALWKINVHPAHIEAARNDAPKIIERRRKEWSKRHPEPQGAAKKLAHEKC